MTTEHKTVKNDQGLANIGQPLATIITPSFNQGKFIEDTIKSVLKQDYLGLEYIVVDGGSTDNTLDILHKYEDHLTWISEPDEGQSDAINKGLRMAKGDIVAWLNSDDVYMPGAISSAVDFLIKHPDVAMVYGKGAHIYENGEFMEEYPTEPFDFQRLAETCYICQPAVFVRANIFNEVGMLDTDLHFCMDYDFWIRIAKRFKVSYLPKHLASTRWYQDTKTLSKRVEAHAEIIKTVKQHYGVVPMNWIYAYSHYVLDRFLTRDSKTKDVIYVSLLTILVSYYNHRVNRVLPKPADLKEWGSRFLAHLKAKGIKRI
ncbi:MAG: glycosyltransferase [Actinobacteria bacterium]|nr:glycosyltransferase [Actinomycetota bacterium]